MRARTSVTTVVAAALAASLVVLVPQPVQAVAKKALAYSAVAFDATNQARQAHDRAALAERDCLQRFAADQARAMAAAEKMFHQDLGPVLKECGLQLAGENVAYGYPNGEAVVQAWLESPSHRANILRKRYRLSAVAARRSEGGTWYVSQLFGRAA